MFRTFNMGIGLILVVSAGDADVAVAQLRAAGEPAAGVIGAIAPSSTAPSVRYVPGV
jgi:phosphoribosylformylglycinamidine cyclo-ligase